MDYTIGEYCIAHALGCWHEDAKIIDVVFHPTYHTFKMNINVWVGDRVHSINVDFVPTKDMKKRGSMIIAAPMAERASCVLLHAAHAGKWEVIREMLHLGADAAVVDGNGRTPLMLASIVGCVECVTTILVHLATRRVTRSSRVISPTINMRDNASQTALTLAIINEHFYVVCTLLEAGASVHRLTNIGHTPLMIAAKKGDEHITRVLMNARSDVTHVGDEQENALTIACKLGHIGIARALLESNASIDHERKDGMTPLFLAAKYGHDEVVHMLVHGFGANTEHELITGETSLMLAVQRGHERVVLVLLAGDANIHVFDTDGFTPLMIAARFGRVNMTRYLLNASANIEAIDTSGWTALMMAARYGHAGVVKELVHGGARIDTAGWNGWTALMGAAQNDRTDVVHELVVARADMEATDRDGYTALMIAATRSNLGVVSRLIDAKALVNRQATHGWTALMLVCSQVEYTRCERMTVETNAQHLVGTVMNAAQRRITGLVSSEMTTRRMAQMLLRAGAKIDLKNIWGRDAFSYSVTRPMLRWEMVRRAVRVRPYALHWIDDYSRRVHAPDSEHMAYQRAAWAGDARECELVFLRAQVRELKKRKREGVDDAEAMVRHHLGAA